MVNVTEYNAFTLAEVLITLGVIGVVAAITLPTLINNAQDKILEAQYAKCKNIIANGYKLMMANTENVNVSDLPFLNKCNEFSDIPCVSKEHKAIFNIAADLSGGVDADTLPQDYIISGETEKSPFSWYDMPYIFVTTDGMTYGVLPDESLTSFSVVADVNGGKNPNTVKKDLYKFRFSGEGRLSDVSFELEEISSNCAIWNPGDCRTEEACLGLNGYTNDYGEVYGASWSSGSCHVFITGHSGGGDYYGGGSGDPYGRY